MVFYQRLRHRCRSPWSLFSVNRPICAPVRPLCCRFAPVVTRNLASDVSAACTCSFLSTEPPKLVWWCTVVVSTLGTAVIEHQHGAPGSGGGSRVGIWQLSQIRHRCQQASNDVLRSVHRGREVDHPTASTAVPLDYPDSPTS